MKLLLCSTAGFTEALQFNLCSTAGLQQLYNSILYIYSTKSQHQSSQSPSHSKVKTSQYYIIERNPTNTVIPVKQALGKIVKKKHLHETIYTVLWGYLQFSKKRWAVLRAVQKKSFYFRKSCPNNRLRHLFLFVEDIDSIGIFIPAFTMKLYYVQLYLNRQ